VILIPLGVTDHTGDTAGDDTGCTHGTASPGHELDDTDRDTSGVSPRASPSSSTSSPASVYGWGIAEASTSACVRGDHSKGSTTGAT
jgi:hypothetical protein